VSRDKHIILIGFKNTGKSTVGKQLAESLHKPFIDLDEKIEANYSLQTGHKLNCRKIFALHGENFFRDSETQALKEVLASTQTAVIALGGGAPLKIENQKLITSQWLVHISAEPGIVYERIMAGGKPAYFPDDKDPLVFFNQKWRKHQQVYASLTPIHVDNSGSVEQTVRTILEEWDKKP
jgi:shikimate kinase